ncbi:hypothetical protein PRIPAC_83314 [Pristionchus pacificus]|uniref:Fatty-acid and retinol-binding protein 1 n=1 Tax=Pristionchus pacificus TaxID=54126 RepID=A0A454XLQ7_PRIPA|nr:hypothetical protein PRIPAC_83314 [Pristionchus pacificus]|eukprot:PDM69012.1 hypothetical protein PRIPAC_47314 [Pristionchus pacificus]
MRSILLFCVALAVALAAPLTEDVYAKGIDKLKEALGEGVNVTAAKAIVADEAAALGITTEEHWATCFDDSEAFSISDADTDEVVKEFSQNSHHLTFESKDQIFPKLKQHMPKTHASLVKFVGENFAKYDEAAESIGDKAATAFLMSIKDTTLEVFVKWSQAKSDPSELLKFFPVAARGVSKMMTEWDQLPKMSKNAMEKKVCLQTAFRMVDSLGPDKGQITELKKQANMLIAMGAILEEQMTKEE